jgi:hypothetical protein
MAVNRNILVNLWYAFAILAGLYFAYREGVGSEALLFAAVGAALIVCAVIVIAMVYKRYFK